MRCKNCNAKVFPTQFICHKCGKLFKPKKFRHGWFICIVMLVTLITIGIVSTKFQSITENLSISTSSIIKPSTISANLPTPFTCKSGTYKIGSDIPVGRYMLTATTGTGNIFVYKNNFAYINEVLVHPTSENRSIGVTKIELTLSEDEILQISGLKEVTFSPVPHFQKTILSAGYHIVGIDVPSGTYTITTPQGSGNFIIYDSNNKLKYNYIIKYTPYSSNDTSSVSLHSGDQILIHHLNAIELNYPSVN